MHFPSSVRLVELRLNQARPGFENRFHRASFELLSDGLEPLAISLWVHSAYPEPQLEAVSRAFLAGRLRDLQQAADEGAMTLSELDALWQTVAPAQVR